GDANFGLAPGRTCRFCRSSFDAIVGGTNSQPTKQTRGRRTMQFHTHIHFNGQCEEAFRFYECTLGAKIESLLLYEGTPAASQTAPEWHKKVIHGRININGQTLMACDCPAECYTRPQGFSVSLTVKNPDEAERLFHALAEDGSVQMPLQETFWAVRF